MKSYRMMIVIKKERHKRFGGLFGVIWERMLALYGLQQEKGMGIGKGTAIGTVGSRQ